MNIANSPDECSQKQAAKIIDFIIALILDEEDWAYGHRRLQAIRASSLT